MNIFDNVVATTRDWLAGIEGVEITAYDPACERGADRQNLIEPDQAINLPAAERARMDRAMRGVRTPPDRL
jgi:hypothetical protein